MSTKHKNPYKRGAYHALFAFAQSKQVVTVSELVKYAMDELGKVESAARATVGVLISPTEKSYGNLSGAGYAYYFERLAKKEGEERKLRLRWRPTAWEKQTRKTAKVEQKKTRTTKPTRTKAKAKSKAKTKAQA